MDNTHDGTLAAAYADSVERERNAWDELRSFPPGSIGRARAWEAWSRAIVSTNHTWRRLTAVRLAHPAGIASPVSEGPHVGT